MARLPTLSLVGAIALVAPAWGEGQPLFDQAAICRAAMGLIMAHDPKAERVVKTEGQITYLRYVRPNDRSIWSTRCRIEGNRVFWASDPGRWRDDPRDELVTYEINGAKLKVVEHYGDGSSNAKTFKRSDL